MACSIIASEVTLAEMGDLRGHLVIVTGLALCQGRRVETVLGTDPVPGAAIRQPGQTLRTTCTL